MKRAKNAIMTRMGRRGIVLAIFSLVFFFLGLKGLLDPSVDAGRFMLYALLPPLMRALLWIVPSILGLVAAFQTGRRSDAYGFSALTIPAVALIGSYTVSWVGFLLGITDWSLGWVNAIQWVLILTMLMVTSGWQEVQRHTTREGKSDE